ncbi:MBL fold metallo-hydrolase [Puia dinghuensis]|uniref:3',5'-cyclic-nucleotide phosphodiesterase n=1 Tax=Puia dinghuensis TaxID=1792502 RepID=A0A8J2UBF0_9BACT|nr:3',5'-cyclic-nucleotide phosphodiesterase [Puia dinghuensis]GGA93978.1 3',5'-cyclic-nucleotide phosphodiesterase [Puia dinghuensis]
MNTPSAFSRLPLAVIGCLLLTATLRAQTPAIPVNTEPAFTVIPLGVRGGLDESNLSSYMVAAKGGQDYICLDAGTIYTGIKLSVDNGLFPPPISAILRNRIKGYFISHPHLDHVAGLIISSPDDSAKNIYGLPSCLTVLKEKYFTWESWANFGDDGEKPQLKKYHYVPMEPGKELFAAGTPLFVQAFPLSHGNPYESTAFLVRNGGNSLLYFGDTGADSVEHSTRMQAVWQAVAPLVTAGKLKAIFIEVSFPNEQPVKSLFGHLTPALLQQELQTLAHLTGAGALKGLPVVITHRKPVGNQEEAIRRQLLANNPLQVKLIFPQQAHRLDL